VSVLVMKRSNSRGAKGHRKVDMTKVLQMELNLAKVVGTPIQAKEALPPDWWSWVEPCVWTKSMSNALIKGVKGGK